MKKNTKILIIVCAAALILAGLMCLLIFLPKGDGSSSGAATYDEGVKMSVTTDKDGVHQAQIQTNDKGEIDNNSYGTLMDYIPAKISKIHLENKKGTLDIKSYTPTDKNGKTSATQYTIVGYEDFDLQGGIADNIANNAASIDFTKVMTLDGSKLADYGLDKPRDTVTVRLLSMSVMMLRRMPEHILSSAATILFILLQKILFLHLTTALQILSVLQSTMRHLTMTTVRHRQLRFQVLIFQIQSHSSQIQTIRTQLLML